jgi:hypothetical protein
MAFFGGSARPRLRDRAPHRRKCLNNPRESARDSEARYDVGGRAAVDSQQRGSKILSTRIDGSNREMISAHT